MIRLSVQRLAQRLLPVHKRTAMRIVWIHALMSPLRWLIDNYYIFRKQALYNESLTSQVTPLVNYLNSLFDPTERRIYLTEKTELSTLIELSNEAASYQLLLSLDGETPDTPALVRLLGEGAGALSYDFIVHYPSGVDASQLQAAIKKVSIAGIIFTTQIIS